MSRKIAFVFIVFTIHIFSYGQDKVKNLYQAPPKEINKKENKKIERKYHLKVYYNFFHTWKNQTDYSTDYNQILETKQNESDFGRVSASFVIEKQKSIHEIGIAKIGYKKLDLMTTLQQLSDGTSQITSGQTARAFELNLKYEYNYKINSSQNKFNFLIGASSEPYFKLANVKPKISSTLETSNNRIGFKFHLVPKCIYNLTDRVYFDLNFPIEFLNSYWHGTRVKNPTLSKKMQRSHSFEFDFFGDIFQFRIGVGVKL